MNPSVTPLTIDVLPEVVYDSDRASPTRIERPSEHPTLAEGATERTESTFSNSLNRKTGVLVSVAIAAVAGSHLVQGNQAAQYEGKLQLLVEPDTETTAQPSNQSETQVRLPAPTIDYATQVQILWSPKVLAPVVEQLKTQYPDLSYDKLSSNLEITHQEGSKTLEVRYQDTNPQRTKAILEKISQAYVEHSQECRASLCRELKFIQNRLPLLQQQVVVAQRNLQVLQQQTGVTNPERLGKQLSERSSVFAQQQLDLQIQLAEARTAAELAQKRLAAPDNSLINQVLSHPRYQSLLSQFQTTANQLADEMGRSQPNSAVLQSLKKQYQQLSVQLNEAAQQPVIAQITQATVNPETINYEKIAQLETLREWATAANQIQLLETSRQAIDQANAQLNQQIKQWASLARKYAHIQLELRAATDNLNLYQSRQANLQKIIPPDLTWRVTAPPQVEQAPEHGLASDLQRNFSLEVTLCFLLVVWIMLLGEEKRKPKPRFSVLRPDNNVQPEYSWQMLMPSKSAQPPVLNPVLVEADSQLDEFQSNVAFLMLKAAVYAESVKAEEASTGVSRDI